MSVVQCARKRNKTTDRISNLPENVTQQILECLPLQDAARTSILSRHWRNKWASIPQLLLDEQFFSSILKKKKGTADISQAHSKAVNDILLSHVGLICKFVLYIPSCFPKETGMCQWIRYARSNGVKDFTLVDYRGPEKNLPISLFSCEGLTHLTLIRCKFLSLPPTFRGFPCLVSLKVGMDYRTDTCGEADVLEILISKCPKLWNLSLGIYDLKSHLIIRAPKLYELFVEGWLCNLSLEGTTTINKLALDFLDSGDEFQRNEHMSDFFSNLLKVECLILGRLFWVSYKSGKQRCPRKFPRDLERLRSLKLVKISTFCRFSVSLALCLVMSSPNLERLYIEASNPKVPDGQSIQTNGICNLPRLENVQIIGISGLSNELQLIKILLACSPALEEMIIELSMSMGGTAEKFNFLKESIVEPHQMLRLTSRRRKHVFRLFFFSSQMFLLESGYAL